MNERIKQLAIEADIWVDENMVFHDILNSKTEKFAELIVRECMKEAWDEIIDDENIDAESDPLIREYLIGQNQGIVDAVIRFRNHFGIKE